MNPHALTGLAQRHADAAALTVSLRASRRDTLATFAIYEAALAPRGWRVPQISQFNPPLWELGHVGWFQHFWIGRNAERARGIAADPQAPRRTGLAADAAADACYDSSHVPHATRWSLALLDADGTRDALAAQLEQSLACLAQVPRGDDPAALYFFQLALLHEDMHHEAALYMAQALGLVIADPRWQTPRLTGARVALPMAAGAWELGEAQGADACGVPTFTFDNELGAHRVELGAGEIDCRVVSWTEFLPFVEAGGYARPQHWSEAGRAWLAERAADPAKPPGDAGAPRYLRRDSVAGWQQWRHGAWLALDPAQPACHLTAFEAEAWCHWAGRRLPSEAEWERAAVEQPAAFDWGAVWEWTASRFEPHPGFTPHPYRDYSAPWFGTRRVLRGASCLTQPRLHHPRYRNFFTPERNDVAAGFRSCAA